MEIDVFGQTKKQKIKTFIFPSSGHEDFKSEFQLIKTLQAGGMDEVLFYFLLSNWLYEKVLGNKDGVCGSGNGTRNKKSS